MPEFFPELTHELEGLDDFTRGYIEAAEWLLDDSTDNERGKSDKDIATGWAPQAVKDATEECAAFQSDNCAALARYEEVTGRNMGSAGHDFWLTRNHHGAGFWDRGDDECLKDLTDAAHSCGERDTYTGDDCLIYFS